MDRSDDGSDWEDDAISHYFYSTKNQEKYEKIKNNAMDAEKVIKEDYFQEYNLIEYLKKRNLFHAVIQYEAFVPEVIKEFYAHLSENFGQEGHGKHQCVYHRGYVFFLNAKDINTVLHRNRDEIETPVSVTMDEIARELTAGKLQNWPSGTLDLKYCYSLVSVLARICLYNWLPSSNNNKLSQDAAMLLYIIKMGYNVNLVERILKHLENF